MATNATFIGPTRGERRHPNALGYGHPGPAALVRVWAGGDPNIHVSRRGLAPVPRGSLGTAIVQKPPSGNFYRAGEYCPQVDAGKTTQDSTGRTLIGRFNNGLRWQCA